MDNLPQYIDWFRNSATYINAHRKKVFVVLLSGESLEHANFENTVYDISLLHSLGVKLVLVHGARPQIEKALAAASIETTYHRGLRVTDVHSLQVIKQTIGALGIDIEALFSMGLANSPMHGADIKVSWGNFITAKPAGILDGVDYGHTGLVRKVNARAIQEHLDKNNIVLVSSLGCSPTGETFSLAAEEVATETAIALGAEKLILFIPQSGVLDQDGTVVSTLDPKTAQELLAANTTAEGSVNEESVLHSLEAALKACQQNVNRSHLISYEQNGALIQELFTRDGTGTLVCKQTFEELRSATIDDVGGILELIKPLEETGVLVHRSRELLETEIDCFKVIELEGMIIACAAVYPLDEQCGEIACIAIHPQYRRHGRGEHLLSALEAHAARMGLKQVIVLTTMTAHWFLERGFEPMSINDLPEKRQNLYNYQRNSRAFKKRLR